MSYTSLPTIILLSFLFALAGFIDSIAGGGGLVSLTSLYAAGMPAVNAVSTNKFSMTFGTLFATGNYARKKKIIWRIALSSVPFALIGSSIGAQLALHYADTLLRYMLLIVLPVLTVLTLKKKGTRESRLIKERNGLPGFDINAQAYIISASASLIIGVYDGFFGPGTGTFYTILFSFMGLSLIFSAGTTKVLNLASNIAAFVTFLANGTIVFQIGIPCAVSSVIGNLIGSWYALKNEGKAIRKILIIVIALLYVRILSSFFL